MSEAQTTHAYAAKTRFAALCLLSLILLLTATGCGDSASDQASTVPGRQVTFTTDDGVLLSGHLFGRGANGVVLSHMFPADQKSWYAVAKRLAADGYQVLTYDFRGYGLSEGSKEIAYLDRDVIAACQTLTDAGATRVVLVGASMGGTASLKAASVLFTSQLSASQTAGRRITVAGVASLSAPVSFEGLAAGKSIGDIYCPLLFIAAKDDAGADEALELQRLSSNTGDLKIVSGSDHGTDLLTGTQADKVYGILADFLRKNLPSEN